jgi:NADH-quinone oxidoreductase subunit C
MSTRLERLEAALRAALDGKIQTLDAAIGELTLVVKAEQYLEVVQKLRDDASLRFQILIDLCGADYSDFGDGAWEGPRYAVVLHLLSIEHNWRLRVRTFAPEDSFPVVESVTGVWPGANWYEREAFDLYGIMFNGHDDLRRLLTDYGFVGHPFRKDFPLSGNVEMRYDADQKRVIYQPVTIEPREIVPRIVREETYAESTKGTLNPPPAPPKPPAPAAPAVK